jgi:hypothetical protein
MPVEGRGLSSRPTHDAVRDLENHSFLQYPCFHPAPDQTDQARIPDAVLHELEKPVVVETSEDETLHRPLGNDRSGGITCRRLRPNRASTADQAAKCPGSGAIAIPQARPVRLPGRRSGSRDDPR